MSILFKTILCPVDFERNSIAALDLALKLGERDGATIYLLNVAPIPVIPAPLEPSPGWEQTAKARLDQIAITYLAGKVAYGTLVRTGEPAAEIAREAEEVNADLVVTATHGRSGVPRLLLGSVAERVLRELTRPLLIIRPHSDYNSSE